MVPVDRRRLLLAGGGLASSFLFSPALVGRALAQDRDDDRDDEVTQNDDPGYDLDVEERLRAGTRKLADLPKPPRFVVDPTFLPPVGNQGRAGTCVSWAVGYGLTTFMLARRDRKEASERERQVSPAYLYGTVKNAVASGCRQEDDRLSCDSERERDTLSWGGTNVSMTLSILHDWGAVSFAECPYPRVSIFRRVAPGALYNNIFAAWSRTRRSATLMKILGRHRHRIQIDELKAVLAQNEPLAYTTRLPKDFKPKEGGGPWEEYRTIVYKNRRPAGHAMLLVGYDDEMVSAGGRRGAFLVQNSWGQGWGISAEDAFGRQYPNLPARAGKGFVWITYEAFGKLAKDAYSIEV